MCRMTGITAPLALYYHEGFLTSSRRGARGRCHLAGGQPHLHQGRSQEGRTYEAWVVAPHQETYLMQLLPLFRCLRLKPM
jgi:hypothetical protein